MQGAVENTAYLQWDLVLLRQARVHGVGLQQHADRRRVRRDQVFRHCRAHNLVPYHVLARRRGDRRAVRLQVQLAGAAEQSADIAARCRAGDLNELRDGRCRTVCRVGGGSRRQAMWGYCADGGYDNKSQKPSKRMINAKCSCSRLQMMCQRKDVAVVWRGAPHGMQDRQRVPL